MARDVIYKSQGRGLPFKGRGVPPAYMQIERILREEIASGGIPVGGQLPTEEDLVKQFSVSRHTVRAAIQSLVTEGIVERFSGRGTFVKQAQDTSGWGARSLDDILDRTFRGDADVLSIDTVLASTDPEAAISLRAGPDDRIFRIRSLRSLHGVPLTYVVIYLPEELSRSLPDDLATRLKSERLLYMVERSNGVRVETLRQTSSACLATDHVARLLKIPTGSVLLQLRNIYFDLQGTPIETSMILCSPNRYRHTIELHRDS